MSCRSRALLALSYFRLLFGYPLLRLGFRLKRWWIRVYAATANLSIYSEATDVVRDNRVSVHPSDVARDPNYRNCWKSSRQLRREPELHDTLRVRRLAIKAHKASGQLSLQLSQGRLLPASFCHTLEAGVRMKTAITVRVDAALLIEAQRCARLENRTLTNFIETLLQRRIAELATVPNGGGVQTPAKGGEQA